MSEERTDDERPDDRRFDDERFDRDRPEETPSLEQQMAFNRKAIRPVECLTQGWDMIKGNYWLIFGITVVAQLIAGFVPFGIILGPMMCGIYLCLFRQYRGKEVKFEMLFKGFDYFVQSLIATLIWILPVTLFLIVAYIVFIAVLFAAAPVPGGKPGPNAGLAIFGGMGLFYLTIFMVIIAAQVITFFTYQLIVDRKLKGVEAVRTSFRAATANLGGVIGLVLLIMLLNLAGSLVCCVGQLFIIPVHYAAAVVAYRKVFPAEGAESIPPPEGPEADYGPPPGTDEA